MALSTWLILAMDLFLERRLRRLLGAFISLGYHYSIVLWNAKQGIKDLGIALSQYPIDKLYIVKLYWPEGLWFR
ncbi:hypothetical protein O9993_18665 [Vibrio lentus]|nr:hypothetical protein [Vibrio lentus]